jgi:hypothetical protein
MTEKATPPYTEAFVLGESYLSHKMSYKHQSSITRTKKLDNGEVTVTLYFDADRPNDGPNAKYTPSPEDLALERINNIIQTAEQSVPRYR